MHNVASIEIEQDIIQANDKLASANRKYLDSKDIFAVDLVGAVGSGKTLCFSSNARTQLDTFTIGSSIDNTA